MTNLIALTEKIKKGYFISKEEALCEYSVWNEHLFRKFRALFSGKAMHTFPDQSAVI